jgi:RecA-family ATPase
MELDLDEIFTLEEKEPSWVVEGIIPAGTIIMVAGDAGVGKSVMSLSEGLHIALGRPFLGHKTSQRRVLYFDEENSRPDLGAYLQRIWSGMGQPALEEIKPFFRIESFSLGSPTWPGDMESIIKEFAPGMVYIDTATSALSIIDENSNAEAQKACNQLRNIIKRLSDPPAIKILKHAKYQSGGGKEGRPRRVIRGAKAWKGAVDQTHFHIRAPGAPKKGGLYTTILVPDKIRAFGLARNIRVIPEMTTTNPKGLILHGESFESSSDLMVVSDGE